MFYQQSWSLWILVLSDIKRYITRHPLNLHGRLWVLRLDMTRLRHFALMVRVKMCPCYPSIAQSLYRTGPLFIKKTPSYQYKDSHYNPWVNRLYFESPRASSFLGLRLVKARHKNLVPLLSGVKPDPMVGSGRYAEPIPVKCPLTENATGRCVNRLRQWYLSECLMFE